MENDCLALKEGYYVANSEKFKKAAGPIAELTEEQLNDDATRHHLEHHYRYTKEWEECSKQDVLSEENIEIVRELINYKDSIETTNDLTKRLRTICRKKRSFPNNNVIRKVLKSIRKEYPDGSLNNLLKLTISKKVRSTSGVSVITVLTSPGQFSCLHDCHYCPNEPAQPRSYLSTEPAVLRGNQCEWDSVIQFWDRSYTLYKNGHIVDKVEALVLGGTWNCYSDEYQTTFCRDLFFAANTFKDFINHIECLSSEEDRSIINTTTLLNIMKDYKFKCREPKCLLDEQKINETADCRIIGLTLETRPDYITLETIKNFRDLGCTRLQMGVQHTDNKILNGINRQHTIENVKSALKLLLMNGYKVDFHLMPDLPFSSVDIDVQMFRTVLSDDELQADQWKIYPCEVTPFTTIKSWYEDNSYVPYFEKDKNSLFNLILAVKKSVHPWIRLNRVIRDIPLCTIIAGINKTNVRQLLAIAAQIAGWKCSCIRCREVRQNSYGRSSVYLIRSYTSNDGTEYFISSETSDRSIIFGFCRLRIPNNYALVESLFDVIKERCALIRELHVYGNLVKTGESKSSDDPRAQHSGIGKTMLNIAELISSIHNADNIAIISGIGVRNYYLKRGYSERDTYMVKNIASIDARVSIVKDYIQNPNIIDKDIITIEYVDLKNHEYVDIDSIDNAITDYLLSNTVTSKYEIPKTCSPSNASFRYDKIITHDVRQYLSSLHNNQCNIRAVNEDKFYVNSTTNCNLLLRMLLIRYKKTTN